MTKFPLLIYNTKNTKCPAIAPPAPPSRYEDVVGWPMVEKGYKNALRGQRKFTREAVRYDLFSEISNFGVGRTRHATTRSRRRAASISHLSGTRSCSSSPMRNCRIFTARSL